jgi:excisionase family DNA binding protein
VITIGEVLDKKGAQEILKVGKSTLEKLMRQEDFPVHKIGKLVRFDKEELIEWLKKQK